MSFLRNCQAALFLSLRQQLEYRFNFFLDVFLQPAVLGVAELCIWSALIASTGDAFTAKFSRESYLTYALWAAFIGRVSENWRYEFAMHSDIESGSVNALLLRPISFYEFYLWQFIGYKGFSVCVSVIGVYFLSKLFGLNVSLFNIAWALVMVAGFWVFHHTLSFAVASFTFVYSRASAFTVTKNFIFWVLMGMIFPLDLLPDSIRALIVRLPLAAGVYYPVGFISGRLNFEQFLLGFKYLAWGTIVVALFAMCTWRWGLKKYTGTGA